MKTQPWVHGLRVGVGIEIMLEIWTALDAARQDRDALRGDVERLRAWMSRHGTHSPQCDKACEGDDEKCCCGLDAAIRPAGDGEKGVGRG